ncbi:MAG: Uncharacterised protein [Flavobacterium sp. SCGC AAA160-P02]|nr:MAG: Uncharacterised protein [Flavobacterium sp. SCGC AAA160-P02]
MLNKAKKDTIKWQKNNYILFSIYKLNENPPVIVVLVMSNFAA